MIRFSFAFIFLTSFLSVFAQENNDSALLDKLVRDSPFGNVSALNESKSSTNNPSMLTLRGITCIGDVWFFSIYDASTNASYWIRLKDGDSISSPIKADFFDEDNNILEISTANYTHNIALKEQDAFTGAVPNITTGSNANRPNRQERFQRALSRMSNEQRVAMALQLAASMSQPPRPPQANQRNANTQTRGTNQTRRSR